MIYACMTHFMRLSEPVLRWQDAAPIGNGVIGALIFGYPREELILTNHGRLFERPEDVSAPDMTGVLPRVRALLLAGQRDEAEQLWTQEWKRQQPNIANMGCYLPGPRLLLHTETRGLCTHYSHLLDFSTGVDELSFEDGGYAVRRRTFTSRSDDALIMDVALARPTDLSVAVTTGCEADGALQMRHMPEGMVFSLDSERYGLSGALRLLAADGEIARQPSGFVLQGATHVLLSYALEPVHDLGEDSLRRLSALQGDFDALLSRHAAIHRPLMEQVQFSLNGLQDDGDTNEHILQSLDDPNARDLLLMRLFHFGRYLLISSTRPGAMPPNLQGIWNGDRQPAWMSDYHNDVNIQMNYWQALMGGLSDMMLSLFDYYDSLIPDFQENARRLFGCRGIAMSVSQTLCGKASCNEPTWSLWTGGPAWIAQHYFDYWRYTRDDDFLRERALPFMREAALFYEDFADFSGEYALFVPSISPENVPMDGQKTPIAVNATMDIALAHELFTNLISACRHLNMWLEEAARWEKLLKKLPPYERDEESGALREWLYPGLKENPNHRHESHLYGVFPGEEIGPNHPMFDAARIAVELRRVVGLNQQTGWSLANMACVRARLGNGDEALDGLEVLERSCVGRNLFTYHNDWRAQGNTMFWGHDHINASNPKFWFASHPPFQIDANLCIPAAVMNMLVNVRGDDVTVLPALPKRWKKGFIKGLCLPNGRRIDIEWEDGKANYRIYEQ